MLNLDPANSIYYRQNKEYCDFIIAELDQMHIEYSGFCSSFGYDIFTEITVGEIIIKLNFHKHQSTGIPLGVSGNSKNYSYTSFETKTHLIRQLKINRVTFLDTIIGGMKIVPINANVDLISKPVLNQNQLESTINFIEESDIVYVKLKNGILQGDCRTIGLGPKEISVKLLEQIKNWDSE